MLLDALGRCSTPWQIFHGTAYNTMLFSSAGSFVFCFILCKTECTHHLTKELSLKEAGTVNKRAERRSELVFCPRGTGLWLCSCPPYSLMCGLGQATSLPTLHSTWKHLSPATQTPRPLQHGLFCCAFDTCLLNVSSWDLSVLDIQNKAKTSSTVSTGQGGNNQGTCYT